MEKEIGRITFTQTDTGYRVDMDGEALKKMMSSCCCLPFVMCAQQDRSECCPPEKEK